MNRALAHQTTLAIQVIIRDETGTLTYSLLLVTKLFVLVWQIAQWLVSLIDDVVGFVDDVNASLSFTGQVLSILVKAIAFGLGVRR